MNTRCALAIAVSLALPAAAGAAPDGETVSGRWSVGVGLAVPAFAAGGAVDLPPFLVLSAPFRSGGWRVEPELGLGSGWEYRATTYPDPVVGGPYSGLLVRGAMPIEQRWYRAGLTVAPEWAVSGGASLYAGPRLAALVRRSSFGTREEDWTTSYDCQLDLAAGGELAVAPGVSVGTALRFGWTIFDVVEDPQTNMTADDADGVLAGEALLSVRIAL